MRRVAPVAVLVTLLLGAAPQAQAAQPSREPAFGAEDAPVRPGSPITTGESGRCTANFVFTDRAGRVYLGQAAHCAQDPADASPLDVDACDYGRQLPTGTPVKLGDVGVPGRLAYSSWATMQERGETDPGACRYNDFSLVEVRASEVDLVNPSLPVFGGPTGVNSEGPRAGDVLCGWGNSPLWQGLEPLSPKRSVVAHTDGSGRAHWVYSMYPGVPGDSGGPYVDPQGRALGSLSELSLDLPGANIITDIGRALSYAEAYGGFDGLRLVPGTAPFVGPLLAGP